MTLPQRQFLARVKSREVEYDPRKHGSLQKSKEGSRNNETVERLNEALQGYNDSPKGEKGWQEDVGSDLAEKEVGWKFGEDVWSTMLMSCEFPADGTELDEHKGGSNTDLILVVGHT